MSIARRLSIHHDAVTAWPGRAALALALSVATLAAMPAAAEAQDDPPITVRFERSAESVHEGDLLGLSVHFSEPPGRLVPDGVQPAWGPRPCGRIRSRATCRTPPTTRPGWTPGSAMGCAWGGTDC